MSQKSKTIDKDEEEEEKGKEKKETKYDPRYCNGGKIFKDPQLLTKRKVGINNSTSKQMYRFGTEKRFHSFKKEYDAFFYNLPSVKDRFTTSFGIGGKSDFTKNVMKDKSHSYYDVPREFDLKRRNTPQYSFGYGRDVCKRPEYAIKKPTPGVGSYNLRKGLGEDALKFSIFGREWDHRKISPSNAFITPGPGQYEETLKTNEQGNYVTSLYGNTWKIRFAGPERFKVKYNKNPPPGAYELGTMFNKTGLQFSSQFNSTIAKTMSHRPNCFYAPYRKTTLPGPGTYDVFSDFNGYTDEHRRCRCGRRLGHPPVKDGASVCNNSNRYETESGTGNKSSRNYSKKKGLETEPNDSGPRYKTQTKKKSKKKASEQ